MITAAKKIEQITPEYEVVGENLGFLKKGDLMVKDSDYYINDDESVILRSDNLSSRIIKKIRKG